MFWWGWTTSLHRPLVYRLRYKLLGEWIQKYRDLNTIAVYPLFYRTTSFDTACRPEALFWE